MPTREILWGVLSDDDVRRRSVCEVTKTTRSLEEDATASEGTMCDHRMGCRQIPNDVCGTCFQDDTKCVGNHMGRIELFEPVFLRDFSQQVVRHLRRLCCRCRKRLVFGRDAQCPQGGNCVRFAKVELNERLSPGVVLLNEATDVMTAKDVRDAFDAVPEDHWRRLGIDIERAHPSSFIPGNMLVEPNAQRPWSRDSDGKLQPHAWTKLYLKVLFVCEGYRERRETKPLSHWRSELYFAVNECLDSSRNRSNASMNKNAHVVAIMTSLSRKEGTIRGQILGKSVDHCARSVVTGDTHLALDEVGIPFAVAKTLTVPERVTEFNRDRLLVDLVKGNVASLVATDGTAYVVDADDARKWRKYLVPGCLVHRRLRNGDPVLFNRQPTLFQGGIMGFRARIISGSTFRLPVCVVTSFNADFDGDEMNLHVPQSELAMAEVATLMSVKNNVVGLNGNVQVGLIQNALTAVYRLSGCFSLQEEEFCQVIASTGKTSLPHPAAFTPGGRARWTGVQLLNECVSRRLRNENGDVVVSGGEYLAGRIGKREFKAGMGKWIRDVWVQDVDEAVQMIHDVQRVAETWQERHGLSMSLSNFAFDATDATSEFAHAFDENMDDVSLSNLIERTDERMRAAMARDPNENSIRDMCESGAKGKADNVRKIVAFDGPQRVNDACVPLFLGDRRFCTNVPGSDDVFSRGFVRGNLLNGLSETEMAFSQASGRDGIVGRANRTSDSGYTTRRLVHMLMDFVVHYDYTVRDSVGRVIQFRYGADGMSPQMSSGGDDALPVPVERRVRGRLVLPPEHSERAQDLLKRLPKRYRDEIINRVGDDLAEVERVALLFERRMIEPGTPVGVHAGLCISEPAMQAMLNSLHGADNKKGGSRMLELLDAKKTCSRPEIVVCGVGNDEVLSCQNKRKWIHRHYVTRDAPARDWVANYETAFGRVFTKSKPTNKCLVLLLSRDHLNGARSLDVASFLFGEERSYRASNERYDDVVEIHADFDPEKDDVRKILKPLETGFVDEFETYEEETRLVSTAPRALAQTFCAFPDADHRRTTCDDVPMVLETMGIEAARTVLLMEFMKAAPGADVRHWLLLCDVMTSTGDVQPVRHNGQRHTTKSSVANMCFERVNLVAVNAAVTAEREIVRNASSCIFTGADVCLGTGFDFEIVPIEEYAPYEDEIDLLLRESATNAATTSFGFVEPESKRMRFATPTFEVPM